MQIDLQIERAYYGDTDVPALNGFSLRIEKGEAVAVLGKSGCGKSTLLNIIASLHKGYAGRLITEPDATVGYIPQNKCLLPWKNVINNVMLLGRLKHPPDVHRADEILTRLRISHLKKKFPSRLSGGEYQRVLLGQVLYYKPRILLMDEPFSALDDETKAEAAALFTELQREQRITTVFVTHNTREAETVGTRIVKLSAGQRDVAALLPGA
jgi:ABC-type nitrate/sulfonate/bicarbonate transport system ATPase subunit